MIDGDLLYIFQNLHDRLKRLEPYKYASDAVMLDSTLKRKWDELEQVHAKYLREEEQKANANG